MVNLIEIIYRACYQRFGDVNRYRTRIPNSLTDLANDPDREVRERNMMPADMIYR